MRRAWLLLPLALAGCGWFAKPQPAPTPHYVLGDAYEAGDVWYYPHARYDADETGLAGVQSADHAPLTTDGERFDPTALAAAHQTLQLPAIARVTNLETGRQVVVRLNDRGPASPNRLIAVTPRAAELLGFGESGVARVRVEVLGPESHAAADALAGAAGPVLAIETAPRGDVQQTELAPPEGIAQSSRGRAAPSPAATPGEETAAQGAPAVPLRLPETVTQTTPNPGMLFIRLGTFSRRQFAERQAARVGGLGPSIERERIGRSETYSVSIGPIATVPEADRLLDQVIRADVPDARIVVE